MLDRLAPPAHGLGGGSSCRLWTASRTYSCSIAAVGNVIQLFDPKRSLCLLGSGGELSAIVAYIGDLVGLPSEFVGEGRF